MGAWALLLDGWRPFASVPGSSEALDSECICGRGDWPTLLVGAAGGALVHGGLPAGGLGRLAGLWLLGSYGLGLRSGWGWGPLAGPGGLLSLVPLWPSTGCFSALLLVLP